jgi:hypothetical protein
MPTWMLKIGVCPYFLPNSSPGGLSEWEPPDPIPNSEVKLLSADDSVGLPHVKVGHCQAFNRNPGIADAGVFLHARKSDRLHPERLQ